MRKSVLVLSLSSLILSGCWDQHLLKDAKLIYSAGFDQNKDGKITSTVTLPNMKRRTEGMGEEVTFTFSAKGVTPRDARINLNRRASEVLDASKNKLVFINKDLAKKGIYPLLDIFYRDPNSSLNAKVAVVKGSAKELLSVHKQTPGIDRYLMELLRGAESLTYVEDANIQDICPIMFDPGQDFLLPYLSYEENNARIDGMAMFHFDKYVGNLNFRESKIYLMLAGKTGRRNALTVKTGKREEPSPKDYLTMNVYRTKPDIKIKVSRTAPIEVTIKLHIKGEAIEYPEDHFTEKGKVESLNKKVKKSIEKEAKNVIRKLQKANCDAFGIGRRMIAYHNDEWKKLNWKDTYPNIVIKTDIKVTLVKHGIIN